jgi:hypothetical protein
MVTIIYNFPKTGTKRTVVPAEVMASHLRSIERNGGTIVEIVG